MCIRDRGKALVEEGNLKLKYKEFPSDMDKNFVSNENGDIYISAEGMGDNWLLVSEISRSRLIKSSFQSYFYLTVLFAFIIGGLIIILNIVCLLYTSRCV